MKTIAKRVLLLLCLCLSAQALMAHESVPFEGEVHYRIMDNVDKNTENITSEAVINGGRDAVVLIKNNKVLYKDEGMNMNTLHNPDSNKIVTYFPLIKEGYSFDYNLYIAANNIFSDNYIVPAGFECEEKVEKLSDISSYKGYIIQHLRVKKEISSPNMVNSFVLDLYYSPNLYIMPPAFSNSFQYGLALDGVLVKCICENHLSIPNMAVADSKTYSYSEIKDIVERSVSDEEFSIPEDVNIKEIDLLSTLPGELSKKNAMYKEQNNLMPQESKNIKTEYRIDEEWDF